MKSKPLVDPYKQDNLNPFVASIGHWLAKLNQHTTREKIKLLPICLDCCTPAVIQVMMFYFVRDIMQVSTWFKQCTSLHHLIICQQAVPLIY